MGRYYSGDIDGKFWFAIQSSDCADRFGSVGTRDYLNYWFDESHLEEIEDEIKQIKKNIGRKELKLMDKFFKENNGYNDDMLIEFFEKEGCPKDSKDIKYMLEEYADLGMGKKILKCVKETGECSFTAEL